MAACILHGFYGFELILVVICMVFLWPGLWRNVLCMGFIQFRLSGIDFCMSLHGFYGFEFILSVICLGCV